ncbi:MAG TPA: hypothetical protein PLV83_05260 [Bacilli bacterium]|nr:hypothetical protein [Bacilli bacterium]
MKEYDLGKFIEFVNDLVSEDDCFMGIGADAKYYFLHGGCYELYKIIKNYFPDVICMVSKDLLHCASKYKGIIYDSTGIITDVDNYREATLEDIRSMENFFGLGIKNLESKKIIDDIEECNIRGRLC